MQPLLIGEQRPHGQGVIGVLEPALGQPLDEVAAAGPSDLDAAVAAAKAAFPKWAALTAVARAEILFRFADLVRAHGAELATLEARNVGKPIGDARWEADHVADTLRYYAGAADKFFGQTIAVKKGGLDVTLHDPLGVVGLIVPWNFPMVIATWKLAPALACGNTVVLKPASLTPLTALRLGEIGLEAGRDHGGGVRHHQARRARARREVTERRVRRRRHRPGRRRSGGVGVCQCRAGLLRALAGDRRAPHRRPVHRGDDRQGTGARRR